jgi:hypothetical protein
LKELLHIPLLVLLLKDRFAFSDLRGWRIRASSAEEAKEALEELLEEEALPFIADACHNAPRPYGEARFLVLLSISSEDPNPLPLAKEDLSFHLHDLEEGKERIRDFFLQNTAGMERFICVVEVISLGRYYAWLLRVPGAKKSTPL